MKTEEQIKEMLELSLKGLAEVQEWEKNARESYSKNSREFGSADLGEVFAASEQVEYRKGEVEAIKWVLK